MTICSALLAILATLPQQDTTVVRAGAPLWGANVSVTRELGIGAASGAATYMFAGIMGVAVSPEGNIFVAENRPAQVRMYDASGKFVKQLARAGQGPGELASPQTLSFFRDHLYVRDGMNSRIAVLSIAGGAPVQWPYRSNSGSPQRMTIHPDGTLSTPTNLVTATGLEPVFFRYSASGAIRDTVRPPRINYTPRQLVVATTGGTSRYSIPNVPSLVWGYTLDERFVGGLPDRPAFLVASGGRITRVERDMTPVRISEQQRQEMQESIVANIRSMNNPKFNWTGPGIPEVMPYYSSIDIDADNRIWIRVAAPARRIPPAGPGQTPRYVSPSWFDVYSSELKYLGQVRIPHEGYFGFGAASGNHLWGIEAEADGVETVVRYRVGA